MIRLVYNIIFTVLFLVAWPYFFNRMRKRGRLWRKIGERLALFERGALRTLKSLHQPIWIHAVSVGEMKMAIPLIDEIRRLRPDQDVIITTTTVTGRDIGEAIRDAHTHILYHPLDLYWCVTRAFNVFRPSMLILVDQELWPNHIWEARKREIPVWIVNARMSDRSLGRFRRFRGLLRKVLYDLELICVQTDADLPRFRSAGFPAHKLFVVGSLKFSSLSNGHRPAWVDELRRSLGWEASAPVLLAGSTHRGEEKILLECYGRLLENIRDLKLVIVPRHAERKAEVAELIEGEGFSYVRRSDPQAGVSPQVLLVDTTGELAALYGLGSVVFVGKSLAGRGGQNFIEAAALGCPVVLGPHMHNFRDLHRLFLEEEAVVQVQDPEELHATCLRLLEEPEVARAMGQRASDLCQSHSGTQKKIAAMIDKRLAASA
jgi:3-deoxy-D-manno-octulosonic-acid transferase